MSDQVLIAQQPVAVISVETEAGPVLAVATRQVGAFVAAAGQGAAGRDGRDGSGSRYEHLQMASATPWTVNHNLGHRPVVSVLTLGGEEQIVAVKHLSVNTLLVLPDGPTTGLAICL